MAFSLGIVALAFTRKWRSEMTPIVIATFASVLVILPVHRLPDGFYVVNLPRLVMHLMPVVFSATVPALVARLGARTIDLALAAASLYFCFYATNVAFNDNFAPLDFTLWARQHPGTRVVYFDPFRATEICDRTAGPRDVIAIDAGPSAWIYPAYGAALQRRVELIPPGKGAPVIPRDAQWVIIDRSWNRFWGDPNFSDLSDWRHRLGGGLPSAEDTRVIRAVVASGQFKAVFFDRARLQAVFRRKP
ncbi:MAG TPA: hypothetical protein VJZ00_25985 [Thermoanaerobaculia bacterium]|nr:hypothetical protein [Thermoanaerobaculia bacterium]